LAALALVLAAASGCAGSKSKSAQLTDKNDSSTATGDTTDKNSGRDGFGSYSVVSGDNLWNIAGRSSIYGDPYKWPLIYKANKSRIPDADLIYPGQIFDIDRSASSAAAKAAVNHARTRGAWSVGSIEASDSAYLSRN
jgi:nucleoid-associated protein YgaU